MSEQMIVLLGYLQPPSVWFLIRHTAQTQNLNQSVNFKPDQLSFQVSE